ncbi:MAG: hypothetical protein ISN28_06260 [Ectothiorhodospiraceae bacterium AqS1]|nr:hypothetical protein [Ectothiorhodospiraceae bacterium AqS1]
MNSTQTAYDYNACIDDCSLRAIDPNFDYAQCDQDCEQYIPSNQASVDIMDRLNGTQTFASSVRIGDPQPMCGTDAWACFNGTDDESPMIRDVGIFGVFASGDCHHPLGCGY